ncbi:MAG: hypothetical protein NZ853_07890 [Leptospiraceae bacterium]|nr:hypothetical protein [Leptospiraceae bacterium]MDW7976907.1 hypothetical protein [Leptospiraceae bacterium]
MNEEKKLENVDTLESSQQITEKVRKRKPFADEIIRSEDVLYKRKRLATKGDIKRIRKESFRYEGKKVITDDVKKLKSLDIVPKIPREEIYDYYVEPIKIEYYIPKDSKFKTEIRYLYIPLIDPPFDERYPILNEAMKKNRFLDVIEVINEYPEHTTTILESYRETFTYHEQISNLMKEARRNPESYRTVFYLCETLMKFEPTLAYLEVLGDYITWNLNWLIRKMNELRISFSAEDDTIMYLIKRRNIYWEENQLPFDERFEILAALFYDQAYPNRGLSIEEQDYFFGIFDK